MAKATSLFNSENHEIRLRRLEVHHAFIIASAISLCISLGKSLAFSQIILNLFSLFVFKILSANSKSHLA
jgi:hypothetical protein